MKSHKVDTLSMNLLLISSFTYMSFFNTSHSRNVSVINLR